MKTALQIVGVRTIFSIDKPIVVFDVVGHDSIVRNPRQAITDLQNSGRALDIDVKEFSRGIENVSQGTREKFIKALMYCNGKTLTGDIKTVKAGDEYVVTGNHPALVDPTHEAFGKVKEGGSLKATKDGVWVEGFLTIPLTQNDELMDNVASKIANAFASAFGMSLAVPTAQVRETPLDEDTKALPTPEATEAFAPATATASAKK